MQREDTEVVGDFIFWLAAGMLVLVFTYVAVRLGSFAYFRTKLEYLRAAMKEMRKGDQNGL